MKHIFFYIAIMISLGCTAQTHEVTWLTFEELEEELIKEPRKVLIHLYADWCVYCKKMEQDVYTKNDIEQVLNDQFYAVKFNVESEEEVNFGGKRFINKNSDKRRQAYHEIAELLATRGQQPITLPAVIVINDNFEIEQRYFRYIPPQEMLTILKE
ncbi:MAG: thioredoxin family protein [bacterium]